MARRTLFTAAAGRLTAALASIMITSAAFAAGDDARLIDLPNLQACQHDSVKAVLRDGVRASLHENFALDIEKARQEAYTAEYEKVVRTIIDNLSITFSHAEASDISVRALRICKAKVTIRREENSVDNFVRYAVKLAPTGKKNARQANAIEIQLFDLPVTSVVKTIDVLMRGAS